MLSNNASDKDTTSLKEAPFLWIKGFLMGSADIVPGVSGGTMALILGIYERLLTAIKSVGLPFFKALFTFKLKEAFSIFHWKFVLFLFVGIFSALIFFTKIVPLSVYMVTEPELVYGLFFGLIVGSIYILLRTLKEFGFAHALMIAIGALIGWFIVNTVPTDTPETAWFSFISGAIAIMAMILPGISGSYILLILRKYEYILSQIGEIGGPHTMDAILNIIPFALGAIIGIMIFSRFLTWLLKKFPNLTLSVLIGFLIGSLYVIWPLQIREFKEVKSAEWVSPDTEEVVQLKKEKTDTNLPKYYVLGESRVVDGKEEVELIKVRRKLIHSEPILPSSDTKNTKAFGGMIFGLLFVIGIEKLREEH